MFDDEAEAGGFFGVGGAAVAESAEPGGNDDEGGAEDAEQRPTGPAGKHGKDKDAEKDAADGDEQTGSGAAHESSDGHCRIKQQKRRNGPVSVARREPGPGACHGQNQRHSVAQAARAEVERRSENGRLRKRNRHLSRLSY